MNTTITARHFTASDRLQNFANENVNKLEKFYDGLMSCDIVFMPNESPENPQKVELKLKVARTFLNANEEAPTYEQAIMKAVEDLRKQLIKYKEKHLQFK